MGSFERDCFFRSLHLVMWVGQGPAQGEKRVWNVIIQKIKKCSSEVSTDCGPEHIAVCVVRLAMQVSVKCSLRGESRNAQMHYQRKNKKIATYSKAAKARRASFTPILATCDAVFEKDAELYVKRLSAILSKKWKSSYSKTVGFIRARLQICIEFLRSVSLCLRGWRTKWRGAGAEDAAAIPSIDKE